MIDVRSLANGITSQVTNANIQVTWQQSTGYTTDSAGKRTPTYSPVVLMAQVQGLSAGDLKHVDGLNIEGVKRSIHITGNMQGVVRADQKGGDIIQFAEYPGGIARNWKVVSVMETWPTWSRVIVVLQS